MQPRSEADVKDIMARAGIECQQRLIADGKIHRFKIGGYGKANGWYWLIERNGVYYGTFGDWKTQVRGRIGEFTPEIRRGVQTRIAKEVDKAARAALKARDEWADLGVSGDSEYLKRKQVAPFGVRFHWDGSFSIPMLRDGLIVGLQRIYKDGTKRFTPGCAKKGAAFRINGAGPLVLCEGYATGASIHMATGYPVLVCFDAGNMVEVARTLECDDVVIIAADNDRGTVCRKHGMGRWDGKGRRPAGCLCNPGVHAAREAAKHIKDSIVVVPESVMAGSVDFNDVHVADGLTEVAAQLIDAF